MEDRARRVPIADDAAAISERMKQIAKGDPQPSSIGTPSAAPRRNLEEEWLKDVGRRLREILAERPKPIP